MSSEMEVYDAPPERGADYVVRFKIKNGPLLRVMRMRGYKTAADLSRASGINPGQIGRYLSLLMVPMRGGTWTNLFLQLAAFLKVPPECLYPEQHLERALRKSSGEFEVTREEIALLTGQEQATPEQIIIGDEVHAAIEKLLGELKGRDLLVIQKRYGFDGPAQPLEQIAKEIGTSPERVRQIEYRALRKFKHPVKLNPIKEAHNEYLRGNNSYWMKKDYMKANGVPARLWEQAHYKPAWKDQEETRKRKRIEKINRFLRWHHTFARKYGVSEARVRRVLARRWTVELNGVQLGPTP